MPQPKLPNRTALQRNADKQEVSDAIGIAIDTVSLHVKQGVPHEKRKGKLWFNVEEYRAWMVTNGKTGLVGIHADDLNPSPDMEAAKLRKEVALATKYELQVAKEKRELIPAAEVRQWIGEHVGRAKNKLIGMASAISPRLEGLNAAERQQEIERYIELVITDIRDASAGLA